MQRHMEYEFKYRSIKTEGKIRRGGYKLKKKKILKTQKEDNNDDPVMKYTGQQCIARRNAPFNLELLSPKMSNLLLRVLYCVQFNIARLIDNNIVF